MPPKGGRPTFHEKVAARKEEEKQKKEAAEQKQAALASAAAAAGEGLREAQARLDAALQLEAAADPVAILGLRLDTNKKKADYELALNKARSIAAQRSANADVLKNIEAKLKREVFFTYRSSSEEKPYVPAVALVYVTETPRGDRHIHSFTLFNGKAEYKDADKYVKEQMVQLLTDPSKVVIHNGGDELASISKFLSRAHADDIFGQVRAAKSDDEGLEIFWAYAKGRGGPRLGASSSAAAPAHAYPSMADFEVDFQPGEKERLEAGLSGRKNPAKVPAGGGAGAEGPGPRGPRGLRGGRPGSRAGNLRNVAPGDAEADGPDGAGMGGDASEPRGDDSLSGEGGEEGEEGEEGGPGSGTGGAFGGITPNVALFGGAGFSGPGGGGLASGAGLMGGAEGAGDGLSRGAGRGGAAEASTGPDGMPGVSGSASDIANKRAQPNGQVCL